MVAKAPRVVENAMKSHELAAAAGDDSAAASAGPLEIRVGLRIRHARMNRGLRLRELADQVGCSESLLSKIENDKVMPSLNVLHRISERLGLTVGQLLSKANEPQSIVSRAGERPVVTIDPLRQGHGMKMERLIPYDPSHLLQGSIHVVESEGGSLGMISHEGEEVGYVIEGRLELTIGDRTWLLEQDDSFCFRSEIPHGYRNPGPTRARVIFINTPPSF
jgi:transcriptional regulator with XRE-family HTH domain